MLQNLSVLCVTEHAILKQFALSLSALVEVVVVVNHNLFNIKLGSLKD